MTQTLRANQREDETGPTQLEWGQPAQRAGEGEPTSTWGWGGLSKEGFRMVMVFGWSLRGFCRGSGEGFPSKRGLERGLCAFGDLHLNCFASGVQGMKAGNG